MPKTETRPVNQSAKCGVTYPSERAKVPGYSTSLEERLSTLSGNGHGVNRGSWAA